MTPGKIKLAPNADGFGAEVTGLDLSRPLSPTELGQVKAAFAEHVVLWFPNQPLTHDQLEAFTRQWGDFGWDPYIAPLADRPHILEVRRDAEEKSAIFGAAWHSDWSFQETPPAITVLHAKTIPPVGGDTLYADGYRAYEALSARFQTLIAPLRAIHSATRPYGTSGFYAREEGRTGMKILPSAEADKAFVHPLVRIHPVTGRRALFVNPTYTIGIEGLTEAESAAILGFLFEHMTQENFVYRHRWAANMLTLWDNRCCLHNATGGYDGYERVLHRTTVAGEAPIPA
jgi:taurine dioxygenase